MDARLKHLNALRTFESAARHQSYSKAAEELFVSQAAVSQQIRQLENAIEVKLFIRTGRKMKLTQSGEKLYCSTQQALSTLIQGFNDIQCEAIEGNMTITSTQGFSSFWLMPRLYKFSILHPEISIKIVSSSDIEDLQQNHIDLAIRFSENENIKIPDNLTYVPFGQDNAYPVCSPKLAKQMQLKEPKDILNCWLIKITKASIDWRDWFVEAKIKDFQKHKMWSEVSSSDLALNAVLAGHGVALTSKALFSQYLENGLLVMPFDIKHPTVCYRFLIFDPNSAKRARIKVFTDWIKQEMADYEQG